MDIHAERDFDDLRGALLGEAGELPSKEELIAHLKGSKSGGSISVADLAYAFKVTPQKATKFIQRLVKDGVLVSKGASPGHLRVSRTGSYKLAEDVELKEELMESLMERIGLGGLSLGEDVELEEGNKNPIKFQSHLKGQKAISNGWNAPKGEYILTGRIRWLYAGRGYEYEMKAPNGKIIWKDMPLGAWEQEGRQLSLKFEDVWLDEARQAYYVLLSKSSDKGKWVVEFGDKDKEAVQAELQSWRDGGHRASWLKVIGVSSSRQSVIDDFVKRMNEDVELEEEKSPKFYVSSNEKGTTWWVMKGGMPMAQKKSLGDILKSYSALVGKEKDPWYWDWKTSKFKRVSEIYEDVELEEDMGVYMATAVAEYKNGKWTGTTQLPAREISASSEREAERKATAIYKKLVKAHSKIPSGSKAGTTLHLSVVQVEDVELDEGSFHKGNVQEFKKTASGLAREAAAASGIKISGSPKQIHGVRSTTWEWLSADGSSFVRVILERSPGADKVRVVAGDYVDGGPSFTIRLSWSGSAAMNQRLASLKKVHQRESTEDVELSEGNGVRDIVSLLSRKARFYDGEMEKTAVSVAKALLGVPSLRTDYFGYKPKSKKPYRAEVNTLKQLLSFALDSWLTKVDGHDAFDSFDGFVDEVASMLVPTWTKQSLDGHIKEGVELGESRPGPHWNPWPTKKTKVKDLIQALEQTAKFAAKYAGTMGYTQQQADVTASVVWAMKKGDKGKVRKIIEKHGDDVIGGVNEIMHWLDGLLEDVELSEGFNYTKSQLSRLDRDTEFYTVQISGYDGGATKHMTLDKELADAVNMFLAGKPLGRSYKQKEMSKINLKAGSPSIKIYDYDGHSTNWMTLNKRMWRQVLKLKLYTEDVELEEGKFRVGDKVMAGSVRGIVEDIKDGMLGVRYENGNFKWLKPGQVRMMGKGEASRFRGEDVELDESAETRRLEKEIKVLKKKFRAGKMPRLQYTKELAYLTGLLRQAMGEDVELDESAETRRLEKEIKVLKKKFRAGKMPRLQYTKELAYLTGLLRQAMGEDVELDEGKLSPSQIADLKKETVKNGVPVRFLVGGQALDILTGELSKKHINVMHQPVYWNFTKETARKVAKMVGARAVFSEDVEDFDLDEGGVLAEMVDLDHAEKVLLAATIFWSLRGKPKESGTTPSLRKGVRTVVRKQGISAQEIDVAERKLIKKKLLVRKAGGAASLSLTPLGYDVAKKVAKTTPIPPWKHGQYEGRGDMYDGTLLDEGQIVPGSVRHFLFVLSSKVTQADMRQQKADMKRGIPSNIYRLGHYLKGVNNLSDRLKGALDSTDEKDLLKLKSLLFREFTPDFSPAKFLAKAIDKFLSGGKPPKISGKQGTKPPWESVEMDEAKTGLDAPAKVEMKDFSYPKIKKIVKKEKQWSHDVLKQDIAREIKDQYYVKFRPSFGSGATDARFRYLADQFIMRLQRDGIMTQTGRGGRGKYDIAFVYTVEGVGTGADTERLSTLRQIRDELVDA